MNALLETPRCLLADMSVLPNESVSEDRDTHAEFENLVRTQGGRMLAVARRFFRDEHDALDAVQDAFLSAFKARESFQGESQVGTWLHRIVVNACLMKIRKSSRRRTVQIDDLQPTFDETGHRVQHVDRKACDPQRQLLGDELRDHVRACIDQLPDIYRNIVILRDIEGLDTEETAQLLNVSVGVVKTRLHRARQALMPLLNPALVS